MGYLPHRVADAAARRLGEPGANCAIARAADAAAAREARWRSTRIVPTIAAKIKPIFDKTSNLSLIALMALQTLLNVRSVMAVFGTGGILAGVVFLGVGVAVGWVLGGSTRETRSVLGLGTAQRNIAAALVVANQSFERSRTSG